MSERVRLSPLEVLRAGKWHSALFTTYALSLSFFEGAVLPSLQRAGSRSTTILSDSEGVAGALSETGARHVGRAYSVEPVRNSNGVFHPKLCSLLGDAGPHLIIGSGNLTFGGWGCNLEVVEHLFPQAHPAAFADLAGFLETLPYTERVTIAADDALAEHAEQSRQSSSGATEGAVRIVHNLERGIVTQLMEFADSLGGAEKLTVVSPYFGGATPVQELAAALGLESFEVHVANRVAVNGEHYPFDLDQRAAPVVLECLTDEKHDNPLHAKLIEIVCARGRLLLSGSINASKRALVDPVNVELGVLRLSEERTSLPRQPHTGKLPDLPEREAQDGVPPVYVASCDYAGGLLRGTLLYPKPEGEWAISIDADGEREQLGLADVSTTGKFQIEAPALERFAYSPRRTVLTFARGEERVRGFLSFTDIISASRRLGSIATPLLRIAAGSDEDEDWIDILEWFARNPEQTVNAWRSSPRNSAESEREDQLVPLSSLAPQPDPTGSREHHAGAASAATLDRLLARLRLVVRRAEPNGDPKPRGETPDDEADPNESKRDLQRRAKLANAFDRLIAVLAERVPKDPPAELKRLAELGVHVLQRHPDDAERITDFLRLWIHLACEHLHGEAEDNELAKLAIALVGLSGAYDGDAKRARRQLLEIFGRNLTADQLSLDPLDPDLTSVTDLVRATVGIESWLALLSEVAAVRIGLDDVRDILAALAANADLPALPVLEHSEELAQLKRLIAKGKVTSIYQEPRSTTACPKCHQRLPMAGLEQFRQRGLVRNLCCSGIMLRSDA